MKPTQGRRTGPSFLSSLACFFSGRADLEKDSPMRALIVLAVPSVGLFLCNTLLALVDTIFVSWLGELPMAAMSFTLPVNLCVFATLECITSSGDQ